MNVNIFMFYVVDVMIYELLYSWIPKWVTYQAIPVQCSICHGSPQSQGSSFHLPDSDIKKHYLKMMKGLQKVTAFQWLTSHIELLRNEAVDVFYLK